MTEIFLQLLNVSITASWVVLAVFALRLCLKKAPKWVSCLLWGVVGMRLLLPFSVESSLSLIPSTQTLPQNIVTTQTPAIHSGITAVDNAVNPVITEKLMPQGVAGINPLQTVLGIMAIVWMAGLAIMLLYSAVSSLLLYRSVRPAVRYRDNIWYCDNIDSPFILGVFFPKIYLPSGLQKEQMEAVIAHENAHLKRKDHWWKPLGFLLLSVYWFNPFLWAAYIFLCRDIEMACDEKVIKTMDACAKKAYSQALADCSCNRRSVLVCPLAFGEVGVKDRIKAVLHYKKPVVWIVGGAVVCAAVFTVCFLTDPKRCDHVYEGSITLAATCEKEGVQTFTCRDCGDVYTKPVEKLSHTYSEGKITLAATCVKEGVQTFTCRDCGYAYTQPVEKCSHSYNAGVVSLVASCTAEGEKQFICTVCGDTRKENIPMKPHNIPTSYVAKEPNCTQTGEKWGQCLTCGQNFLVESIPTNNVHHMQTQVITAATCTAEGQGKNTCTRCGHSENITYEKLSHNYKDGLDFLGTCRSEGQRQQICQNCGKEQWLTLPKTDTHSWLNDSVSGGRICMRCGKTESGSRSGSGGGSVLDGTVYKKEDEPQLPSVSWAPLVGGDPNDFSWIYP